MDAKLMRMIADAEARFDDHRAGFLEVQERLRREEQFERARAANRHLLRESHENNLIKGARQRGYKAG